MCKEEFTKKFVTKVCFLFSTCVDEALLCKGIPLCRNKNDLKACKMNLPNMEWKQIYNQVTCLPIDHPEYIMPYGQTINNQSTSDNSHFDCLNRGDENPFSITNIESNETWTQLVNMQCKFVQQRRCLGLRPEICIDPSCKYKSTFQGQNFHFPNLFGLLKSSKYFLPISTFKLSLRLHLLSIWDQSNFSFISVYLPLYSVVFKTLS